MKAAPPGKITLVTGGSRGIGLACAYAGGVDAESVRHLRTQARDYVGHVAQGAAFAAKARSRAGNPADHTDLACRIIGGVTAKEAAAITDHAFGSGSARDVVTQVGGR